MDKDLELQCLNNRIANLEAALKGTITASGDYNYAEGKWKINYSSILSRLIKEAGRWCENYSSDLFIWWSSIEEKLEDGTMESGSYAFAMYKDGIHSKYEYECCKRDSSCRYSYFYRAVWFLDVTVSEDTIEMCLHK